jgi:hypothetical protein
VFELNTADGLERRVLGSGPLEFRQLPPAVVERLDMGYELRKDMLAGQQVRGLKSDHAGWTAGEGTRVRSCWLDSR